MPAFIDSVTALLIHDGKLFLVERHPALSTFAGYQAFPGGKVDPEDADGPAFDSPVLGTHDRRLMWALVRELREELGFDLVLSAQDGTLDSITECGRAITPPFVERRFDTRFYTIKLSRRPEFTIDRREATGGGWATPADWIQRYETGRILVAVPTLRCIRALVADASCTNLGDLAAQPNPGRLTYIDGLHGLTMIPVRSHTLPPATHTNCYVFGEPPGPRLAVDPSPADDAEYERLCATLEELQVDQLLITHHHPDHYQHAERLARRYGWPMLMSGRTAERIRARRGASFFDGIELRLLSDGQAVGHWLGKPVLVLAVPGHDDGQIALMPETREWCIVGDLIQGIGTVVIASPEGNMQQYFESLQRIIDLAPLAIFPSHGSGLATTFRLEETLRHRRAREEQVLQLHRTGHSVDQMLAAIYTQIPPGLLPYARKNIESHLDKLRDEGRLELS